MISYILAVVCGAAILCADQYTKAYIAANYTLAESHDFLKGFIDITYIHNSGGAWGMLSGYTWVLLSVTIVIMLVCIAMLLKFGLKNKLMFWAVTLVLFGGVGNLIDRIFRNGNVIDFLHFTFMPDFPVFNIADCAIVVGAGLLIVYFIIESVNDRRSRKKTSSENSDNAEI